MKRKIILLGALVCLGLPQVRGQSIAPSTLNAAGGTGTISNNEFDWSVGEMALVSTFSTANLIVTQGVLQPVQGNLSVAQTTLLQGLRVYPNPASDFVTLQYQAAAKGALTYQLMDIAGKKIMNGNMTVAQGTNSTKVDVAKLACATYMLQVTCNDEAGNKQTTSYKIEKIK